MSGIGFFLVDTPRIRDVMLRSGSYHDASKLFKVLARGFRHYYEFFQDESLLDPDSKGHQFVSKVRDRHFQMSEQSVRAGGGRLGPLPSTVPPPPLSSRAEKLLTAMREDTSGIMEPPNVTSILLDKTGGITQFDLTTVLFSFCNILTLFPREIGVGGDDAKGIAGYVHLWAVIGSIMGVQDRFNVALHSTDTVSQQKILHDITLAGIKYTDEGAMTIPVTTGSIFPLVPMNSAIYFLLHGVFGLESAQLHQTLSWYGRFVVKVISGLMRMMAWSRCFRGVVNWLARTVVPLALKLVLCLYGEIEFFN